jgi:hypothetical protein
MFCYWGPGTTEQELRSKREKSRVPDSVLTSSKVGLLDGMCFVVRTHPLSQVFVNK